MPGLIIEGVTGSGKSSLFRALQRHLVGARGSNTKLFFSEHYTERTLEAHEGRGTLSETMVLEHLGRVLGPLEELAAQAAGSGLAGRGGNTDVLVVIERFLLAHMATMRMASADAWPTTEKLSAALTDLVGRLDRLELQVVILELPEHALAERVLSTRAWRNRAWAEFLAGIGDDEQIVAHYRRWQACLRTAAQSIVGLEALRIDVSARRAPADFDDLARTLVDQYLRG